MAYNNNKNQRCSCCDYTHFSTYHDHSTPRTFHYLAEEDVYVCSECTDAIYESLSEFEFDGDLYDGMPLEPPRKAVDGDLSSLGTLSPKDEEARPEPSVAVLEGIAVGHGSSRNG